MPNRKRIFIALACFLLLFAAAGPLSAAEKSFDLTIPGCSS